MKNIRVYINIILILSLLIPLSQANSNYENLTDKIQNISQNNACNGLDVVFLVAQSAAMKVNDPYFTRDDGVLFAIEVIGDNALYFCPGYTHRIAVIGFGDSAYTNKPDYKIYIEPTELRTEDGTSWAEQKGTFRDRIPAHDNELSNYEEYDSALNRTAEILRTWRGNTILDPAGGNPRKQAVVIISDAALITRDYGIDFGPVINNLTTILDPGDENKFPSYVSVNLIVYNNIDSGGTVFWSPKDEKGNLLLKSVPETQKFWDSIVTNHNGIAIGLNRGYGDRAKEDTNTDLSSRLMEVMDPLMGDNLNDYGCNDEIWIDPYLSNISILYVLKKGADASDIDVTLTLHDVVSREDIIISGNQKTGNIEYVYNVSGPNERYIFSNPTPGKLTISIPGGGCSNVDLQFGGDGIKLKMISPENELVLNEVEKDPYYDEANPTQFAFQLTLLDSSKVERPIEKELDGFPLTATVHIERQVTPTEPEIPPFEYTFSLDEKDLTYKTVQPGTIKPQYIITRYPGFYKWEIVVTTLDPRTYGDESATPIIIDKKSGNFSESGFFVVDPIERKFDLKFITPLKDEKYAVVSGQSYEVNLEIQLTDENGNDLPSFLTIENSDKSPLQAVMIEPNGTRGEPISLNHLGGNRYGAKLLTDDSTPEIFDPGRYSIEVNLTTDYRGNFNPQWINPAKVNFELLAAEEFIWEITSPVSAPTNYPLYSKFPLFPKLLPVRLEVRAKDLSGKVLNGATVVKEGQNLFFGSLEGPGIATPLLLEFFIDEETGAFIANWPDKASREGEYTLKVNPNPDAAQAVWKFASETGQSLTFLRENEWVNEPWALPLLAGLVLLAVLIIILAFNLLTRPTGILRLVNNETQAVLYEISLGRGVKGLGHTYKEKLKGLETLEVGRIMVKKSKPDDEHAKAIMVSGNDHSGAILFATVMQDQDIYQLDSNVYLEYLA